jgi:hypothetical protein
MPRSAWRASRSASRRGRLETVTRKRGVSIAPNAMSPTIDSTLKESLHAKCAASDESVPVLGSCGDTRGGVPELHGEVERG